MKFIQGKPRNQWEMYCLDQHVDTANEVRLIDLFVNSLNRAELGFKTQYEENGRPAYHPGALLRLFIYGYLNRINSSRQLEKECKRNLELMWLMPELQPDHNGLLLAAVWRMEFCQLFTWAAVVRFKRVF
jgi:transposase